MIAPPYDVVGADDEAALLARSPHNAAHLELAPGDEAARFEAAAEALDAWRRDGVLVRDEQPAFYAYEQRADILGETHTRRCFFAALRLHRTEEGIVRPHEATMSGPREMRLRLQRATRTNISPIFATYVDGQHRSRGVLGAIAESTPLFEADDALGDRHRLWRIDDGAQQQVLVEAVGASNVTIADGHHRYATALAYLDERLAEGSVSDDAPERYVLCGLIEEDEPGLVVLPNHRLVRADGLPGDFFERLGQLYDVQAVDATFGVEAARRLWQGVQANAHGPSTFGVLDLAQRQMYLATARSQDAIDAAMPSQLSEASKRLDALVLTETILHPLLGIDPDALAHGGRVDFTPKVDAAVAEAERGEFRLAFLLNPTRPEQIRAVADAGELMPQKTTFFYPKLATGMVFNPLAD